MQLKQTKPSFIPLFSRRICFLSCVLEKRQRLRGFVHVQFLHELRRGRRGRGRDFRRFLFAHFHLFLPRRHLAHGFVSCHVIIAYVARRLLLLRLDLVQHLQGDPLGRVAERGRFLQLLRGRRDDLDLARKGNARS
jgi:hypothetical protein